MGGIAVALLVLVAMLRSTYPDSLQARIGRGIGMKVESIEVRGRENTPEPLLRAALGASRGDPIFAFSVEQARARIEMLSWVQSVAVERRLPGTIVVDLTEKRPFAVWQNQGKFQLIDRTGMVVTNEDIGGFGNLPLVVGIGAPRHAADMLDTLAKWPALQRRVAALVRVGDRRWNLRLNNGADVMLPEGAEAAAIGRLMELQTSDSLLDRPLTSIDLRLPDRMVLHPAPENHGEGRAENHSESHAEPHSDAHAETRSPSKPDSHTQPIMVASPKRST
jgi:cell division protein FtsQ